MIDGEKIRQGVDAHYYGDGSEQSILSGYKQYSHGTYQKVLGPFPYNDGTDDVYYDCIIKLHNSKAAAALVENGQKTWIPFAHSPHIWPIEGPDDNITDFRFLGGALVVKGAYGANAVISKMCKGTAPVCTKSLSASVDEQTAQIITSLVSKAASTQLSMAENIPNDVTKAPIELKTEPVSPANPAPVNQLTITAEELQKIKDEAVAKADAIWKEKVTALETKDKNNTLNIVFAKVKDPTVRDALIKKYLPQDVDLVKQAVDDAIAHLSQEEEPKPEEKPEEPPVSGKKSKSASIELPKEPVAEVESKTASAPVNKAVELAKWFKSGGKA